VACNVVVVPGPEVCLGRRDRDTFNVEEDVLVVRIWGIDSCAGVSGATVQPCVDKASIEFAEEEVPLMLVAAC